MRITTYMAFLATAILLVIGSTAFAAEFTVKTVAHGPKSIAVTIVGITTDNGVTTLEVDACGTVLVLRAPEATFNSPEFVEFAAKTIDAECGK